jgi:hypothetical protein
MAMPSAGPLYVALEAKPDGAGWPTGWLRSAGSAGVNRCALVWLLILLLVLGRRAGISFDPEGVSGWARPLEGLRDEVDRVNRRRRNGWRGL